MRKKINKKDGELWTLEGLFKELNELFSDDGFVTRNDDPKFGNIRSIVKSLAGGESCSDDKTEDVPTQMNKHFEKNPTCDVNTFVNAILGEGYDEKAEDDAMTACPDGLDPVADESIDISNENLGNGMIGYSSVTDAINAVGGIITRDINDDVIPVIAFIAPNHMMGGVVETIRSMGRPIIVAKEDKGDIIKASVACGERREQLIKKNKTINALVFDEKSGMCRLSINRKDGYDFIFGENAVTRFIIFDELSCPATIPTDIVQDDRKWGKRMTSELPKLIEKRIEESKSEEKLPFADAVTPALTKIDIPVLDKKTPVCNIPEACSYDEAPYADIKQPIIGDIMKDFTNAKETGKVKNDTFVEFMKPENKEAVANAVSSSIAERAKPSDDKIEPTADEVFANKMMTALCNPPVEEDEEFSEEDTNPNCFRSVAEYMAKERVDSIHFWTDDDGLIHCDVQLKTIYKVELEDSDKK